MIDDAEIFHDRPHEAEDRNDAAGIDQQDQQALVDDAAIKHIIDKDQQHHEGLCHADRIVIKSRDDE